jgi:molybdopterin molybdotransferase
MIELDEALAAYPRHLLPLEAETVAVADCCNRVLAAAQYAQRDLPLFDQSAMDGYALRADDVAGASVQAPVLLPVAGHLPAGRHTALAPLSSSTTVRILTGAPLPAGADTVIPQERAERIGTALRFAAPYPAGRNTRLRGDELRAGTAVAKAGQRVSPGLLASLINSGIAELAVSRRPRLCLLTTGDELRPPGAALEFGEINDSNGPMMRAVLERWGYGEIEVAQIGDDPAAVRTALERALGVADLIVSAGGASVGDHDHLPATAAALGLQPVFHGVAQKPGKPMFFGVRAADHRHGLAQAAMFALPGNPGAALVCMTVHVRRALDILEGLAEPAPGWRAGRLQSEVERDARRTRLLRMRLRLEGGLAELLPLPHQDSHMLSNLEAADVLVRVPAGPETCPTGAILQWVHLPG